MYEQKVSGFKNVLKKYNMGWGGEGGGGGRVGAGVVRKGLVIGDFEEDLNERPAE